MKYHYFEHCFSQCMKKEGREEGFCFLVFILDLITIYMGLGFIHHRAVKWVVLGADGMSLIVDG